MTKQRSGVVGASPESEDPWKTSPEVIKGFLESRPKYEHLCTEVAYILRSQLEASAVKVASITSRAKELSSFLEKLDRKGYTDPASQVTDLAGVRVVCLYTGDLAKVQKIVRKNFEVIEIVDKMREKGEERFGYGAVHFLVKLGARSSGARYDPLKSLVCEIQTRTVLQDAWAIIDHHLFYKTGEGLPSEIRSKLNSLAGAFESADNQFDSIRADRDAYLARVKKSQLSPKKFLANELNRDSFSKYLDWKFPGERKKAPTKYVERAFKVISGRQIKTLADLDTFAEKSKQSLMRFNKDHAVSPESNLGSALNQLLLSLVFADWWFRNEFDFPVGTKGGGSQYVVD